MPAYVVADITRVHNPHTYADYRARVSAGIEAAGGRYLSRGGSVDVFEGQWQPGRLVIVRFETPAAARQWWTPPGYQGLKSLCQAATGTNMIVVDGLE